MVFFVSSFDLFCVYVRVSEKLITYFVFGFHSDISANKSTAKKKARGESAEMPDLRKWPKIPVGDITKVSMEVLQRCSEEDTSGLFATPVIEAHPEIADAYLSIIDMPMDLRTIEEERLNMYTSIQMLQDDLVLMYRNCCTFNGVESSLGEIAVTLWEGINHIFFSVCQDLGVLLPRTWKPE